MHCSNVALAVEACIARTLAHSYGLMYSSNDSWGRLSCPFRIAPRRRLFPFNKTWQAGTPIHILSTECGTKSTTGLPIYGVAYFAMQAPKGDSHTMTGYVRSYLLPLHTISLRHNLNFPKRLTCHKSATSSLPCHLRKQTLSTTS